MTFHRQNSYKTLIVYTIVLFVVSACFESKGEPRASGHTNWLKCKSFEDCQKSSQAAACSDGYCVDDAGDRITAEENDLSTDSIQVGDAGADKNDTEGTTYEQTDDRDSASATEPRVPDGGENTYDASIDDGDSETTTQTKIDILPHFGDYTICGDRTSSGIILTEARVESAYSEQRWFNMYDKEQPSDINPGDPILIVSGEIENESGDGPYVGIWADGYDYQGNQVAWTLDSAHVAGQDLIYIELNESSEFELHLSFSENTASVQIQSCAYAMLPP